VLSAGRFCCFLRLHLAAQAKQRGYPPAMRQRAVQLYLDSNNLRRIGRLLGSDHMTVAAWIRPQAEILGEVAQPVMTPITERDELFTFVEAKKRRLRRNQGRSGYPLPHRLGSDARTHG
jgi:transposase-like protein